MEFELGSSERAELISAVEGVISSARARAAGSTFAPTPEALITGLLASPPETGTSPDEVFALLQSVVACGWTKYSGGDLSYIPSGGLETGALAAWLAAGVHSYTGAAFETPAWIALEESVVSWIAAVLGMPVTAEGVLLSGGSLPNQSAVACARNAHGPDANGVVYVSPRSHHSIPKALRLSGIPDEQIRLMPADDKGRVDVVRLRRLLAAHRSTGLRPWMLAAVAGDTDTGSVDPLTDLADLAASEDVWLHVDAAYGGFFALTRRGADRLSGVERADSVTIDAHKSLFLPYGIGALVVKEPGMLAAAHSATGTYLRDIHEHELPHYFERGPENTRPFRGMLIWLPLQLHGVGRFRAELDRMLDLALRTADLLRTIQGIEVPREPELSIALLRSAEGDADTQRILDAINSSGRLHVSSTVLDQRVTIRLAFLHPSTTEDHVDELLAIVEAHAK